jgi:predicted DNA-binding transcriptional regulator AlpA
MPKQALRDEHTRRANKKKRRWIGTMEVAERVNCHPMSIPRLVKTKANFPQPIKLFGKNLWDDDEMEAYLESLMQAAR